ncbi:MAG TPA: VOC family protein [Thermomicrobiales bacterium]|nr:VOC family protein [Thermomicrobiales bacterium]
MLTGIDHVVVAVRDLPAALADVARLGLRVAPGGAVGGPTVNALAGLGGAYLELLALDPAHADRLEPGSLADALCAFLAAREGLFYFALRSDDVAGDVARLRAGGATYRDPAAAGVALPDGTRRAWTVAGRPRPADLALPFLIEHDELVDGRPAWFARLGLAAPGPLGVRGIRALRVAVDDLATGVATFAREYGLRADGAAVRLPGASIELLAAAPRGPRELVLDVADLAAARAFLAGRGVATTARPGGALALDPAAACGARLVIASGR